MTRLVVAANAETDFDTIITYLQREAGTRVADAYDRRICNAIERLVDFPESGSPRPTLGLDVRITVISPYILIHEYARANETITLLRILHCKRDITRDLLGR